MHLELRGDLTILLCTRLQVCRLRRQQTGLAKLICLSGGGAEEAGHALQRGVRQCSWQQQTHRTVSTLITWMSPPTSTAVSPLEPSLVVHDKNQDTLTGGSTTAWERETHTPCRSFHIENG